MNKLIWVVEDGNFRETLKSRLEIEGHTVETFPNPSAILPAITKVKGGGEDA